MKRALALLLWLWMAVVILAAFAWAPLAMGFKGESSRILFFHVPMAWVSFVAFMTAGVQSIRYVAGARDPRFDRSAAGAVELGQVFALLATITGAIWARIMWGSYWNWDPRESSYLLLVFLYSAYLFLRAAVGDAEKRARIGSAYAVFAAVLMPFLVFVAPRVTASLHPQTVINPQGKILMDTPTKAVFFGALAAFTGLFFWMLDIESRLTRLSRERGMSGHGETG